MNLKVNKFALDSHTPEKGSHFDGPWQEVIDRVIASGDYKQGFREGVREVQVSPEGFYSGVVKLAEGVEVHSTFAPRREGEAPVLTTRASPGYKNRATSVTVFIYNREVLGDEATTDADWEIVSVQADAGEGQVMDPVTMARNFLGLEGGTKGEFTAEQFAEAIMHWSKYAVAGL